MTRRRHLAASALTLAALAACSSDSPAPLAPSAPSAARGATTGSIAVNVLLDGPLTAERRGQLAAFGTLRDEIAQINAVTMRIAADQLAAIQALPYVLAAAPDAARQGAPIDAVAVGDFTNGISTWDQDAINATVAPNSTARGVPLTGAGVYVGVLDTGLLDSWRQYFPEERIATQYAIAFGGGGGEVGTVSTQPNKWEHDQDSHGTHVTSSIIGYNLRGTPVNGSAPQATVIPVKVLGQNGSGWSSVVARGIAYMGDLKAGPLANSPVVINMSLGGSVLDPIEKAAIDYAIGKGVIIVASAGNSGMDGMGFPGAYKPVISVAAAGWKQQGIACAGGTTRTWWFACDVAESKTASDFFIADFSSRKTDDTHDLDVTGPGVNVVGPYQITSGKTSYYYLSGTSMSAPHVAGIVALMAEKNNKLTPTQAEAALEAAAMPMAEGSLAAGAGFVTADAALAETP